MSSWMDWCTATSLPGFSFICRW